MQTFARLCARARGEGGQGILEYALIAAIIIVGAVAVLSALSGNLNHVLTTISNTLGHY